MNDRNKSPYDRSKSPGRGKNRLDKWVSKLNEQEQEQRDKEDEVTSSPRASPSAAAVQSLHATSPSVASESNSLSQPAAVAADLLGGSKLARWAARAGGQPCAVPGGAVRVIEAQCVMQVIQEQGVAAPATPAASLPAAAASTSATSSSKTARWAARAAGARAGALTCALDKEAALVMQPPAPPAAQEANVAGTGVVAHGGSKVARWAARVAGGEGAAPTSVLLAPADASAAAGGNKTSRWLARASVTPVGSSGVAAVTAPTPGEQLDDPAAVARLGLTQGFRDGCMRPPDGGVAPPPLSGSAMEAWMRRAANKQFHVAWAEKRHDLVDTKAQSIKGYKPSEIAAQRRHLNPPDIARSYSSVLSQKTHGVLGRAFARSRLDSLQGWVPKESKPGEWIEIDLGRVTTICGIVSQGHNATVKIHNNPYSDAHVTLCAVDFRREATEQWVRIPSKFALRGGGDTRQECRFPPAYHALETRYVKVTVIGFHKCIVLRLGILSPVDLCTAKARLEQHEVNEYKLRAFYRKYKPEKEESAGRTLHLTPGYPSLDVLNNLLYERYGDDLNNSQFDPPALPKTQAQLENMREMDKQRHIAEQQPLHQPATAPPVVGTGAPMSKADRWKQRATAASSTGSLPEARAQPAEPAVASAPVMSKAERWKQRAAAATPGPEQTLPPPAPAAAAPVATMSKTDRWKQRAAAGAALAVAAATVAAAACETQPMSKAERWKLRAGGGGAGAAAGDVDRGDHNSNTGAGAEGGNNNNNNNINTTPLAQTSVGTPSEGLMGGHDDSATHPGVEQPLPPATGFSGPDGSISADRRPYLNPTQRLGSWEYLDDDGTLIQGGELDQPDANEKVHGPEDKLLYMQIMTDDFKYSGWTRRGEPDVSGSMWFKSEHEYHGSISNGKPHGPGKHYLPDGSYLECTFVHGCPHGTGMLIDRDGSYWNVMYKGGVSVQDGAEPSEKEETKPEPYRPTKAECVALTVGSPKPVPGTENPTTGKPKLAGVFPNSKDVRGRLVWARPSFADMPLWNAEKVRGNIVAIVRGPAAPATAVSYGLKMYHAELAGAKAVVFVDYDPNGRFDAMPRIDQGVVQYGVRPTPADVDIKVHIPSVLVLNRHTTSLQEGAQHIIAFAPPGFPGIPYGWKVGFVCVPPQESKIGLSKSKADTLMAEFFAERKKERIEEGQMLKDSKDSGLDQAEEVLKAREFYGGNFFDSMNPLKQVKETDGVDDKVRDKVIAGMQQITGVSSEEFKVEALKARCASVGVLLYVCVSFQYVL